MLNKLVLAFALALSASSHALAAEEVQYPQVAEITVLKREPVGVAAMKHIEADYERRGDGIRAHLSKAVAKTDAGYGARFKVRYQLRDGYIDVYSGIFDGGLREIHVKPMAMADALKLAKQLNGKELPVNYAKPAEQSPDSVTYQSPQDGCVSSVTLTKDKAGRVTEIALATAC